MYDVVFITPNFNRNLDDESIGTLLLATILRDSGIKPKLLPFYHFGDVSNFDSFIKTAVQQVTATSARIVSFYTRCDTYHISLKIAEALKAAIPDVYIIFGGPQADMVAQETMSAITYVDYICSGEGETTIVPLFSSLLAGKPDHSINGLTYRQNGTIFSNPRPAFLADLDHVPLVDYSLSGLDDADLATAVQSSFPIDVGRGCPFSCTFCSTKMFWGRKYRLKSAQRIIQEIENIHHKYGLTSFSFDHDMFTLNREKVIEICSLLKNLDFDISWKCSARIDCLDRELIDIMADSGMKKIYIGIETGSPRMQKVIQKNLNLSNVIDILSYIGNKGIVFTTSFIFGFPDETEEDFMQTMEMMFAISKIPHAQIQHHLCAFFTGTELSSKYINQFEYSSVFSDITGDVAVSECEDLILAHPKLFAHFFEYRSELREKIKHFPIFFDHATSIPFLYEYLAKTYYRGNLCQMLYDFTNQNYNLLNSKPSYEEFCKNDHFLDLFSGEQIYPILKEIQRFLQWRLFADENSVEIFKIDVGAILNGLPIEQIKQTFAVVKCTVTESGDRIFTVLRSV